MNTTEAPTPPRWFEFLLEPGRLQQHLESSGNDPTLLQIITSERLYSEIGDQGEVIIPPDSYEAKYRLRKSYALQTLSIKVASFLGWPLDMICSELSIPSQYKLMQALASACSSDNCPPEVKKFASVMHCHWFLRSAIAYQLSALQPQSSSTTIIYLSQLQQQQQNADNLALMSMGELFARNSQQLKRCSDELHEFIWELAKGKTDGGAKRRRGSHHPFEKAKLSRPKMECFDLMDEQKNDWKQCVPIEPFEFMEAACYDLGRFFFFVESYAMAKETFEIIKDSKDKFPLLEQYLKSADDMLAPDNVSDEDVDQSNMDFCDKFTEDIRSKRKLTEKYLFDCMAEFAQQTQQRPNGLASKGDDSQAVVKMEDSSKSLKEDRDLRLEHRTLGGQPTLTETWYSQVPLDRQQQQLLELGKGDMLMARGNYKQAMGCFIGALMLMTEYFTVFSRNYVDEEACVTRLIQGSISLSCYTQAVALCQMTKNLNFTIAVKQLNERVCHDCCDDLYECIWNVTLLEYIINLHARRGEVERRTKVIQLMGQLELNENNPEEILREAEHVRRGKLLRILSNKYL